MNIYTKVYYGSIALSTLLSLLWLSSNLMQYGLSFFVSSKFKSVVANIVEITLALLLSRLVEYWDRTGKIQRHKDTGVSNS